jgi:hypothetical protein
MKLVSVKYHEFSELNNQVMQISYFGYLRRIQEIVIIKILNKSAKTKKTVFKRNYIAFMHLCVQTWLEITVIRNIIFLKNRLK